MTIVSCPNCGTFFDPEQLQAESTLPVLDVNGIPMALSIMRGIGLPFTSEAQHLEVRVDGQKITRCVAYDREAGAVWHHPSGPDGKPIIEGDQLAIAKLSGTITVEKMDDPS